MASGDTLWSPVAARASVGGGGGLESPERSGGTPTLGGESGDEETREAYDGDAGGGGDDG